MSDSTKKNLIVSIILLLVSGAVFGYALFEVESQNQRLKEQMTAVATKQSQESSYLALRRTAEESKSDRELLSKYFFQKEGDSIDFLNLVESTAPQMSIKIQTEDLQQITDSETGSQQVEVSFTFSGSYENVMKFLTFLENLPYVSSVQTLDLLARSKDDWLATVTVVINVYEHAE
jgi:hypothetical protein